jgi:N-acetylmuramoyl-L-alanine amidase
VGGIGTIFPLSHIIKENNTGGDGMKLYLDPGHGGTDPGASGNGIREKDITLDIALKIRNILLTNYENIEIKMSRTGDTTKSLSQRTNEANAWDADFYLSIHCNAANSAARGYEDYIYSALSSSSRTATYQDIIHAEVVKLNKLNNRGQKKANFHVLRETNMDAFLSENGFIDNPQDAALMKQDSWRQNVAQGHATGVAKAFNLKAKAVPVTTPAPKPPTNPGTPPTNPPTSGGLYKVIAGSFKARANADERVTRLRSKGIESFVVTATISGSTWYRVQAGAFSSRENADTRLAAVKKAGINDAFIIAENGSESTRGTAPVIPSTILGPTQLSAEQMDRFVKKVNPNAPELGSYYKTLGEYYGIRGDVAFAQAVHETNYFRYTGVVNRGQNNYAGIGATGPNVRGATFATPRDGVLAHLQHLYAYATTQPLPNKYPLVDPRFNLVKRGSSPTWIGLNGKWAVPGNTYGQMILDVYEKMIAG